MSFTDPTTVHVDVILARNRAYVKWPYDHKFMKLLDESISHKSRHFYRESKWWHFSRDAWDRAFQLFQSRYSDENISIAGDFSDDEPPTCDEEFPLEGEPDVEGDFGFDDINPNALTMADALAALHLLPWADADDAKVMYRHLSKQAHPDVGGVHENQVVLNRAMEYIERYG